MPIIPWPSVYPLKTHISPPEGGGYQTLPRKSGPDGGSKRDNFLLVTFDRDQMAERVPDLASRKLWYISLLI